MEDVTNIFGNTGSGLIKGIIERGGVVLGEKIEGFAGVLVGDKAYADALQKKVEEQTGVKGYISTDELPAYGISKEEKEAIESGFGVKGNDVVILVADEETKARKALEVIKEDISKRK
ncbi:MAG: hypothetical protein IB616_01355 [Methanosarcinales archaeon]|nr:MAG: hypothetical protein IB616_01355 [Methanosarcinales archaeon]